MATIKFDQVGLTPSGVAGKTRSDGLANGAQVTITTSEAGTVQFLWVPIDDNSAVSSLSQTSPTTWTFTPSSNAYGTYRVKFTATANPAITTVRLFVVRTPTGLRIPALNERASSNASLINHGTDIVTASEFNENGLGDTPFQNGDYSGWWSALSELFMAVDNLTAGGGTVREISSEGTGLIITDETGPDVNIELDWGTTTGKVADGGVVAAISSTVGTHTTQIGTNTSNIATNASNLSTHVANAANPHGTTKAQVGLTNVTDDAQLKRANNDWAGYSAITVPTLSDKLLAEIAAGGVKGTLSLSVLAALIAANLPRDPVWDKPTVAGPDDDEFEADTVLSGAWTVLNGSTVMTRDGAVDLTQACASQHYRSSVVGSTLLMQIRQNESVVMFKQVAAALSSHSIWVMGAGFPTEPGGPNASDPVIGLGIYKNSGGLPDQNNRARIQVVSSADAISMNTNVAGVQGNVATNVVQVMQIDGLALRVNHGSAAAGNVNGFAFRRNQSTMGFLSGNAVQFNSASDKVGINMVVNSTATLAGVNNVVVPIHFVRRIALTNPGFLAQA